MDGITPVRGTRVFGGTKKECVDECVQTHAQIVQAQCNYTQTSVCPWAPHSRTHTLFDVGGCKAHVESEITD